MRWNFNPRAGFLTALVVAIALGPGSAAHAAQGGSIAWVKDFETALAQAKKNDKQVFFRIGSPTCGWCHRLDEFLARPGVKPRLEKDFVLLKIDTQRMTGGLALAQEIRQTSSGGIPWFAFLAPDGKILQTSNNAQGNNIGFPVRPDAEIAYFREMLMDARKHMTPDDVTGVIEELKLFTKPWQ